MAFGRFQDFLSGLVKGQRPGFFGGNATPSIDELLDKLMGFSGEVSAIVTAREVLDQYNEADEEGRLEFFQKLESEFNADADKVKAAYQAYELDPSSANLNTLAKTAEPRRQELFRRLNQTPGATHDLVAMRSDLLKFIKNHEELKAVDATFVRLFSSWFGRSFLVLRTIDWSTSAAILERIIRYEAVHAIKDWDDLRSRIDPPNRRCFAFFHPALVDEPLIFVEVALLDEIPGSIQSILDTSDVDPHELDENYSTAVFYSISNCQPGLKNISFGNFLIKQVVQELQAEYPSIKNFVTLSPMPGFKRWLDTNHEDDTDELVELKQQLQEDSPTAAAGTERAELIRRLAAIYLIQGKRGIYPLDPVARFHLGNGARLHRICTHADTSNNGRRQSLGTMVNYLYDLRYIERNHESYMEEGEVHYADKLKSLLLKS